MDWRGPYAPYGAAVWQVTDSRLIAAASSLADAALRALIHLSDPEPDEHEGDAVVLLLCDALRMAGRLNNKLEEKPMLTFTLQSAHAYAIGYYAGRAYGEELNPYTADELRHAYRLGYDRGVSDFCAEE